VPKDHADLHVERWRDHWIDIPFDDEVEAATVRLVRIHRYFDAAMHSAVKQVGLQEHEYFTLHTLMIRDTPGRASPSALAKDLGVSPAGMTGRLDGLERRGYVKRVPGTTDRRTVDVEVTRAGADVWRRAMQLRGDAEEKMAATLTRKELATLNRLLKKMALHVEANG
jgi:DNA-binding MarR family transcriptional regulator